MDSIEKGATIRIGLQDREYRLKEDPSYFASGKYSIKINKKTKLIIGSGTHKEYLDSCAGSAKEIAEIMIENKVKKYILINGEMIDSRTLKWESCDYMPKEGEEIFKKNLEEILNQSNLKIIPIQNNFHSSVSVFKIAPS
jgi:hypothetical protein